MPRANIKIEDVIKIEEIVTTALNETKRINGGINNKAIPSATKRISNGLKSFFHNEDRGSTSIIEDVRNWKIIKKYVKRNRWFVQLSLNDRTTTIPHAVYIWLKYNPGFKTMPAGYSIHHLDHDSFNDDPSNLALMGRHQHVAHHTKQKSIDIPVYFDEMIGLPLSQPKVYYRKDRDRHYICYKIKTEEGTKIKHITNVDGHHFETREEAEKAIKELWCFNANGY